MSKPVTRKHSAKCLKVHTETEGVHHYVLVGGRWYYNGRDSLVLDTIADKDGFWTNHSIKKLINEHYRARTLKELAQLYGPCKTEVYMREWTTNQTVYGVRFET